MPTIDTLVSATAALGAVLGLVLLSAAAARRFGFARPGPPRSRTHARLAIQASLPLDRLRTVHIIRCDGRDLAVLTGGSSDVALGWMPGSDTARGVAA